jgi:lipopolysaccharide/colanic/teichoic acid biosynthesis glycosyltransferase
MNTRSWSRTAKRGLDLAAAGCGLVLLSPVLLLVAIAIAARMGRPVLFRQVRPGQFGKIFCLLKFRTMSESRNPDGTLRSDAERLTRLGTFLRRTSLDELPQLWNVFRGDMSLVGPRPLLTEYLARYTPEQARRHDVPPGITGWAQVQGRQTIPFSRRLEFDVWYVEHWSLSLDLRILVLTLVRVFSAHGVKPGQDVSEVDDLGLSRRADGSGATPGRKAA